MAKRDFVVEYEFTSTRADGNSYTCTRIVRAHTEAGALAIAKIVGFTEFGAKFTDNCVDWRIVK